MCEHLLDGVGWKARGDRKPEVQNPRRFFPRIRHALKLIPLFARILVHTFYEWWSGRKPFIDIFNPFRHFTYTGVPIGGIGSGSIGTDFRGGFGRFSIIPGVKEQTNTIKANQFIISIHSNSNGSLIYQSLLSCVTDFSEKSLKEWKSMSPENVRYRGLFPRAWFEFKLADTEITVICEQLSPVLPNNYKDSSLPVGNFQFYIINNSKEDIHASITFTFRNGTGNKKWEKENYCSMKSIQVGQTSGLTLEHSVNRMQVTYGIFTEQKEDFKISKTIFNPVGDGKLLYKSLETNGDLNDSGNDVHNPKPTELGIAVCSKFLVAQSSTKSTKFTLVWFMPQIHFGNKERFYRRRYCRFFDGDEAASHHVVARIAEYSLTKFEEWKLRIDEWQKSIIDNTNVPEWYRSAIFNELYFIVDGCTIWLEFDETWKREEPLMSQKTEQQLRKYGRFGYIESWEYFMINTYDVHFYSSWAILKNWPQIEIAIQLDFADQVSRIDKTKAKSLAEGNEMWTKNAGRIPHDVGNPLTDPWIHTNAYILHDTSDWKDLNLKFVINCWRDWKLLIRHDNRQDSLKILELFYQKSKLIVDLALNDWDQDRDGMIENSGFADQTYDVWRMTGTSSYCGSLWIAALTCFVQIAKASNQISEAEKYSEVLRKACNAFEKKLWNGRFFGFDQDPKNDNVVMSDQLSGFWALLLTGEEISIDQDKLKSALTTIYQFNVQSFENGQMGAVNGFLTSGAEDKSCIQSEEVWTGITYSLTSLMIELGLIDDGFKTSEGLFKTVWYKYPLQFQTPEAITKYGMYRAIGYMRPLSIWSIQHSLEKL